MEGSMNQGQELMTIFEAGAGGARPSAQSSHGQQATSSALAPPNWWSSYLAQCKLEWEACSTQVSILTYQMEQSEQAAKFWKSKAKMLERFTTEQRVEVLKLQEAVTSSKNGVSVTALGNQVTKLKELTKRILTKAEEGFNMVHRHNHDKGMKMIANLNEKVTQMNEILQNLSHRGEDSGRRSIDSTEGEGDTQSDDDSVDDADDEDEPRPEDYVAVIKGPLKMTIKRVDVEREEAMEDSDSC